MLILENKENLKPKSSGSTSNSGEDKKKQIKPKVRRQKETSVRTEISTKNTEKQRKKSVEPKAGYLKRSVKIDQPPARMIRRKRKDANY